MNPTKREGERLRQEEATNRFDCKESVLESSQVFFYYLTVVRRELNLTVRRHKEPSTQL